MCERRSKDPTKGTATATSALGNAIKETTEGVEGDSNL